MTGARLAGIVAAALAIIPLAAAASDQDDALRLAARAANPGGLGTATVTLHATPAGFPSSIPLPKGTLVGSVRHDIGPVGSTANGALWSNTLYYDVQNRDAVVKDYEDALRTAGWKHVDLDTMVPGPATIRIPELNAWCAPGEPRAGVTIVKPRTDDAALDVTVGLGGYNFFACSDEAAAIREQLATTTTVARSRSPLPAFTSTPGVTIDMTGPATDGSTTGARITSSLPLTTLFDRLAASLRDAGWTPKNSTSGPGVQAQTFVKTLDGRPSIALLTVYALDATHYVALADVSAL
jgi:hypothetical protein